MLHTNEPWKVAIEDSGSGDFQTRVEDQHGNLLCDLWENGNNHADSARIVSCVNFCAGTTNELLDNLHVGLPSLLKELETQRAENAKLIAERDDFEKGYIDLFNKRAARIQDLQQKVWVAMDKKSCPGIFMQIAADAILYHGCEEVADLKLKIERLQAEREQWMKQEPYGYVNPEDEWSLRNKGYAQIQPKLTDYSTLPLFRHPLPAQQAPVGFMHPSEIDVKSQPGRWAAVMADKPNFDVYGVDFVPVYIDPLPAQQVPEPWTDRQCAEFISVAMRHVDINGEFTWDDIRLGQQFANKLAAPKPKTDFT
jgi:hypothetical protein